MRDVTEQMVIHSTVHFPFIQPVHYGYSRCRPLHTGGILLCNRWVLHYVFSGTGTFGVEDRVYHPKAGDLFIARPNERTYHEADEQDPWTYGWFDFFSDIPLPEVLQQDVISDPRLEPLFRSAYEQGVHCTKENKDSFLYGKLFELIGLLQTLYPSPGRPSNAALIHQVRLYLEAHFAEKLSIADMARMAHMDPSHFVTLFREHTGITPWQYLTNLRLARSVSYLHRRLPVKVVAERVGYTDATAFTRSFKRQFGLPPKEYAKRFAPYTARRNHYVSEK